MQDQFIKSTRFFQHLLSSYFRRITSQVVETLLVLSVCHLFGLYNPNQVADALELPKAKLHREIGSLSLYHAKFLNLLKLQFRGDRQMLSIIRLHFHERNPQESL